MHKWKDFFRSSLLKILLIFLVWFLGAELFTYLSNDPGVEKLIKWFESKDKLSGWAQFIGASIAIFLAVAIPAWQRYAQQLDRRRDRADLDASLSESCYYLLIEIQDYLEIHVRRKENLRFQLKNDVLRDDLLNRIHSVEMKEINPNRVRWLIEARRALHSVNSLVCSVADQNLKLSDNEIDKINKSINLMKKCIEESHSENIKTLYEMLQIHYPLYIRIGLSLLDFPRH